MSHALLTKRAALIGVGCVALAVSACGASPSEPASPAARASAPAGRILFSQQVGSHRDLYAIRPDGHGLTRLTHSAGEAVAPDPSPDGHLVVYEDSEPTRAVIATIRADGSGRRVLTPTGLQGEPAWSPDGGSIAFTRDPAPGDNGVWIMHADGRGAHRLTRNPYAGKDCGCDVDAAFSPDGRRISFVRIRSERGGRAALFVMDRNGDHQQRVTSWRLDVGPKHAWEPDGSAIAVSSNASNKPGESANVFVVRPDGTDLHALTHFKGGTPNARPGSWSPDGRRMAIKTDESGAYEITVMAADGSHAHRITTGLDDPSGIVWGH